MYKVSVIIPIYNMEKYLRASLETVCRQTIFEEVEVVCVNDGSIDRSMEILSEYEGKYKNFVIINQKNMGVGPARNNGIKEASGEFIAFLDPDDYYLENNTLELLYTKAKENNVFLCGGSLSEDHYDGKWIRKEFEGIYKKYTFQTEGRIQYKDYQFDFGFYRFLYDRKFLLDHEIFFPPFIRFQDPPFFVHAMIEAGEFYAVPDFTYCYRYGHQNLVWHEERICALMKGHIENLKMSSDAGLGELHELTLYRLFHISAGCIAQGLAQESTQVWELLDEAQKYKNDAILSDEGRKYGVKQFFFEYCKEAEKNKEELHRLKEKMKEPQRNQLGVWKRMKRWIRQ